MTDEQILEKYNELVEMFGDKLPNPEQYPRCFGYYVKMYNYRKCLEKGEEEPNFYE